MTYSGFPEAAAELRQSAGALSTCEGLGEGRERAPRNTKQGAGKGKAGRAWRSLVCPNRAHLRVYDNYILFHLLKILLLSRHTQPSPWDPRRWFLLALSTKPNFQTLQAVSTAESLLLPTVLPHSILQPTQVLPTRRPPHLGTTRVSSLSCPAFPSYSCVLSFRSLSLTATALETSQGSHTYKQEHRCLTKAQVF